MASVSSGALEPVAGGMSPIADEVPSFGRGRGGVISDLARTGAEPSLLARRGECGFLDREVGVRDQG